MTETESKAKQLAEDSIKQFQEMSIAVQDEIDGTDLFRGRPMYNSAVKLAHHLYKEKLKSCPKELISVVANKTGMFNKRFKDLNPEYQLILEVIKHLENLLK